MFPPKIFCIFGFLGHCTTIYYYTTTTKFILSRRYRELRGHKHHRSQVKSSTDKHLSAIFFLLNKLIHSECVTKYVEVKDQQQTIQGVPYGWDIINPYRIPCM